MLIYVFTSVLTRLWTAAYLCRLCVEKMISHLNIYLRLRPSLWEWYEPRIVLTVDVRNALLRSASITISKPASVPARIFPRELQARLMEEFDKFGVLLKPEGAKMAGAYTRPLVNLT